MRQFLTSGRRPVNRLCPSCRAPFDQPIALFFDSATGSSQPFEQQSSQVWEHRGHAALDSTEADDVVLSDISFYEENMTSLQNANSELSSNIAELERALVVYKRRCEAQEEAKAELQRQVDELGMWLGRVRKSDAEKEKYIRELSDELDDLRVEVGELSEERDALSDENSHYQSLRVTDEYTLCININNLGSMMRILRSLQSAEIQSQIAALRSGSKDEVITQLQIALEMYCQIKEKLDYSQEELLDAKIEVENQKRELLELRRSAKSATAGTTTKVKRPTEVYNESSLLVELENDANIADDSIVRTSTNRSSGMNVPAKFVQKSSIRTFVPDGAGGSRSVLETNSGKRFII